MHADSQRPPINPDISRRPLGGRSLDDFAYSSARTARPVSMTVIAISSIVFGCIAVLLHGLAVIGGGLLAASGSAMEQQLINEFGDEASGLSEVAAAGGNMMMVNGLVNALCWIALIIACIGVLQLRRWGRTMILICGGVFIGLDMLTIISIGVMPGAVFGVLWGGLLVGLFMRSAWSDVFDSAASPYQQHLSATDHAAPQTAPNRRVAPADAVPTGLPGMPPPHTDKSAAA